ncbi:hypothetical protein A6A04_10195 [Paramagnetospirillum marisnigri]|uniref:Flagellar motor switch protein FliG C-terminal domain-containing protein n=1 Tax=Paramagnetospirillum marisnigri TaxID=1285242 RepID=A0A178N026_9PROT|nr:FliG C-terminal domain-containing protein [Paramagnetospirillum marisnigri]OAN55930.1 hypothetical protein A6A04_10195 [Paramagnetospirillum marisnigri]
MTSAPAEADIDLITLAPTRETARDLCLLINDLCHLDKMRQIVVLEDTLDHPERSLLFYAYRHVRDRAWLAEPLRDIFRHITLGLTEQVQVERLLDSRIAAVGEDDRRYIRDTLAGMADTPAREDLRERLNDAAADKVLVLRALRNALAAHVGGYTPQVSADYARFSLPKHLRLGYDEFLDGINNSAGKRIRSPNEMLLPVDPIDPTTTDYDDQMARRLGENFEDEEEDEPVEAPPDLEARLVAIAKGWATDDSDWHRSVDRLAEYLEMIGKPALMELLRLVDKNDWGVGLLGLPTTVVRRVFSLMSNRAQALLLRDMEEESDFDGICRTPGAVSKVRESIIDVIEQRGLADGGAALLKTFMHPHVGCDAFDALAQKEDAELNSLWRNIEKDRMGIALLGTTAEVAVRFLDRLSERARQMMLDDMKNLSGSVTASDIEKIQKEIVGSCRPLEDVLADIRELLASPGA